MVIFLNIHCLNIFTPVFAFLFGSNKLNRFFLLWLNFCSFCVFLAFCSFWVGLVCNQTSGESQQSPPLLPLNSTNRAIRSLAHPLAFWPKRGGS